MEHDSDSDEVCLGTVARPLAEITALNTVSRMMKRLELAEKVCDRLVACIAYGSADFMDAEALEHTLVAWEEARGSRFIYTDGNDHVIATGRGGLSRWLDEQGYDPDQRLWDLVQPEATIAICCDKDGNICSTEDDARVEQPRTRTAQEWLAQVKENGLLCTED